jgi:WD40 repeat protein
MASVDLREPLIFSPDSSRLAIAVTFTGLHRRLRWVLVNPQAGGVVAVWDESGFAFKSGAPEPVNAFFTPDGKVLGWTAHFGIKRIDAATGNPLATLWWHGSTVAACLPTPDNGRMLSPVEQAGHLKEWDLDPSKPVQIELPRALYFATSADGNWIATATTEGNVVVVDAAGERRTTLKLRPTGSTPVSRSAALSRNGTRVAVLRQTDLSVWDVQRGVELLYRKLPGDEETASMLNQLALSPTGDHVAIAIHPRDKRELCPVMLFDVKTGNLRQPDSTAISVKQLQFSPDGRKLAGVTYFKSGEGPLSVRLVVWDAATARQLHEIDLRATPKQVSKFAWSPDSARLAVSGDQGGQVRISIYNVNGERTLELDTSPRFSAFRMQAIDLAFSPDGRRIAFYVPLPRAVQIHDASSGKRLLTLPVTGEELAFTDLAFTADGHRLRLFRIMQNDGKLGVTTWHGSPRQREARSVERGAGSAGPLIARC